VRNLHPHPINGQYLLFKPALGSKEKSPSFWGIFGKVSVKNRFGDDGGRTRTGLVLLLACDELFNRTIIEIVAQQIA
jgi:hypothetical protein